MKTYTIESDGIKGVRVLVTGPDGKVSLTSPGLYLWSEAQRWIEEHRRTVERDASTDPSQ
jgi:hypothetical protein